MKMWINIKRLLVYGLMLLICILYTMINLSFGIPLTASVLLILLLSSLIPISSSIASKSVVMQMRITRTTLFKGEQVYVTVTAINASLSPIPFFETQIIADENLEIIEAHLTLTTKQKRMSKHSFSITHDKRTYAFTIPAKGSAELTIKYSACIWGPAQVSVQESAISDFLGIFKVKPFFKEPIGNMSVCPNLYEPSVNELMAVIQSAAICNDKGQNKNISSDGVNVEPGYDHRDYEPGDPLKRINWKLSAKRDKLLVRNFEFPDDHSPVFILDPLKAPMVVTKGSLLLHEQRIVEGFLTMLLSMYQYKRSGKAYYLSENEWRIVHFDSMDDIESLQKMLSKYSFKDMVDSRVPIQLLSEGCSSLTIFSTYPDTSLEIVVPVETNIVFAGSTKIVGSANYWIVDENYDFYRFK